MQANTSSNRNVRNVHKENKMQDGDYEIYCIQSRTTHKGEHLKIGSPLKPVPKKEQRWYFIGPDAHAAINPWKGYGVHRYPKSSDELHKVRNLTGCSGWFNVKHAVAAFKRLLKADANGDHDYTDPYGGKTSEVRHEFRIVKKVMSQTTTIIECTELISAL